MRSPEVWNCPFTISLSLLNIMLGDICRYNTSSKLLIHENRYLYAELWGKQEVLHDMSAQLNSVNNQRWGYFKVNVALTWTIWPSLTTVLENWWANVNANHSKIVVWEYWNPIKWFDSYQMKPLSSTSKARKASLIPSFLSFPSSRFSIIATNSGKFTIPFPVTMQKI